MEKDSSVETMHQAGDSMAQSHGPVIDHSDTPWYKQAGLRKLYFMMPIMFLVRAALRQCNPHPNPR